MKKLKNKFLANFEANLIYSISKTNSQLLHRTKFEKKITGLGLVTVTTVLTTVQFYSSMILSEILKKRVKLIHDNRLKPYHRSNFHQDERDFFSIVY